MAGNFPPFIDDVAKPETNIYSGCIMNVQCVRFDYQRLNALSNPASF